MLLVRGGDIVSSYVGAILSSALFRVQFGGTGGRRFGRVELVGIVRD